MALAERLMGLEQPKISVHGFRSMLDERRRGFVTNGQVVTAFSLSASEQTEGLALINKIISGELTADEVEDVLIIAEQRLAPYTTAAAVKTRLGF